MKAKHTFKDASDFEWQCDEILIEFMDSFTFDSPYIRELTQDDIDDFGDTTVSWMFTNKGINLMERYIARLQKLGEKLFPEDNIEVYCTGIIQP